MNGSLGVKIRFSASWEKKNLKGSDPLIHHLRKGENGTEHLAYYRERLGGSAYPIVWERGAKQSLYAERHNEGNARKKPEKTTSGRLDANQGHVHGGRKNAKT